MADQLRECRQYRAGKENSRLLVFLILIAMGKADG
jgi:hypothetical protein